MSWYKNEIPKEYKRLEYIQSTGTQYIDTGIPLTSNSRIVMDCELTTVSGTQCFFCSRTEATTTDTTSNTLFAIGSTYRKEYYGESKTVTNSDGANKRIIVDNNKNNIKIGGASLTFSSVSDITSPMNCYLMASTILENDTVGTFSNFAYMKLYSCQIYDNDVLLRNFVPCQRKSDSALGLFDIVGQTFYVNSGTGTFAFKELIIQPKMYIGVKQQLFNYVEQEKHLTVDTFPDFFDTIQDEHKWEVKAYGSVLDNVLIEPTGSYGITSTTKNDNYFKIIPKIDFKGLNITLSYNTRDIDNKVFFSYNGVTKINGYYGYSSKSVIVNLTDVKAGDSLRFWYDKGLTGGDSNEKVQFNLITAETPKILVPNESLGIKELSKAINDINLQSNGEIKKISKGYIGINNLSKLCFKKRVLGDLLIGDTLEIPVVSDWQGRFGRSIIFKIADRNHEGYPDNCTTLITDKIIQAMPFSGQKSGGLDDERKYGSSHYLNSSINHWLNSNSKAGEWATDTGLPYGKPSWNSVESNPYALWAGFLAMLDSEFVTKLLDTNIKYCIKSSTYGVADTYSFVTVKMFLAAVSEVAHSNYYSWPDEGIIIELFKSYGNSTYPTIECAESNENTNSLFLPTTTAYSWWLRTPYSIYETYTASDSVSGSNDTRRCYYGGVGLRPLCNLSNDTTISAKPNANGHYTLL